MRRTVLSLIALAITALLITSPAKVLAQQTRYSAQLSGREEVPPQESNARGHVTFTLNQERTELSYKLVVSRIDNVTAAHIHLGARGTNGPVVVTLYGPAAPGGGRKAGILAEGTITAVNLTGDLAGHSLSDLIAAIEAGNTYVNVHTDDGRGDTNERPGDFPNGEIRGQIH